MRSTPILCSPGLSSKVAVMETWNRLSKKPSVASIISRCRRVKSSDPFSTEPPVNKLKKRLPFIYLSIPKQCEPPQHNVSEETLPPPSLPPQASTTDVPELPCLPIYQTFGFKDYPHFLIDEKPHGPEERCREHKLARPASVSDFHRIGHLRPPVDQRRPKTAAERPPAYDKAAELAKYYRSILPDFESMLGNEYGGTLSLCQPSRNHQQQSQVSQQRPRTIHLCNPLKEGNTVVKPTTCPESPRFSASSCSTAVGLDSHVPLSNPTQHVFLPRPPANEASGWPLPAPAPTPVSTSPPTCGRTRNTDRVGLEVCTKLLTEELAKALQPREKDEEAGVGYVGASSSQVRMMIEAYEGVLERCGKEMLGPAGLGPRRAELEGAIEVLEHWLDSLYAVFEGGFSEDLASIGICM